jgi:exonuclease SbcC
MTRALKVDIQVLENRIRDGEGKIVDNQKRMKEAELALDILEKSRAGKEAFEAAEVRLKSLREEERQRRVIEQAIAVFDKESTRLAQAYAHEKQEVEKIAQEQTAEERRLTAEQRGLVADEEVSRAAARLPLLRAEEEKLRLAKGLLEGRRAGLQEGRLKLAEGVCPFFKEPCQNIAGKAPRDVFSVRVDDLDKEGLELEQRLGALGQEIAAAEKARQELETLKVRGQELAKQLSALIRRRDDNIKRQEGLAEAGKQQEEAGRKGEAHKEELKKFTNLDGQIAAIEKSRTAHQGARDAFFANQKDALDLQHRRDSLARMVALLAELRKDLTAKGQERDKLDRDYDPKRHVEVRLAKEQLLGELATSRQKIADLGRDRLRLIDEIKKMKQIKEEIKARLAEQKGFAGKEELVKFLRSQIFNNVSARLSERFREEISLRADLIYRTIAETDEELSWGDKYQIVLRDMENGEIRERSDDQLSGGQTMSAVVALRLALLQTIGARVAFFDEPTSNLDSARRANLAQAFRAIDVGREEVTEHWYDQLFLISHDVAFTEVTDQIVSLE